MKIDLTVNLMVLVTLGYQILIKLRWGRRGCLRARRARATCARGVLLHVSGH
jgi:hypothetical protein